MNSKMRHTAHILLGGELSPLAPLLRQYSLMYGEGDAPSYLQILSCQAQGEDGELFLRSHVLASPQPEQVFSSGLDHRYRMDVAHVQQVRGEAELQQYFTALFNRIVTI